MSDRRALVPAHGKLTRLGPALPVKFRPAPIKEGITRISLSFLGVLVVGIPYRFAIGIDTIRPLKYLLLHIVLIGADTRLKKEAHMDDVGEVSTREPQAVRPRRGRPPRAAARQDAENCGRDARPTGKLTAAVQEALFLELPKEYLSLPTVGGDTITLYLGDCFAGMESLLAPESVDVVVTSPPYNIGVSYNRYNDRIPRRKYLEWMYRWGSLVSRVLKPDGSLFLNIGSKPSDPWVPFDVAGELRNSLTLQNVIHWIKSIYIENSSYGTETSLVVGHYKPINSKRYVNDAHEYIFHFTRSGDVDLDRLSIGAPYKDGSNIGRWKSAAAGVRCRGNTWYIPYPTIKYREKDRPHPASYPPELAEMCIKLHGRERVKLVLDPFLGIGSTAVACQRLGVGMVGFEMDGTYLQTARDQLMK